MLGLMVLCSLLTGVSGQTFVHVFGSDGKNVNLPSNNDFTDCTSTAWIYSRDRSSEVVVLFEEGIKQNDIERRERLNLVADCSLNIYNITPEDRGVYSCYLSNQISSADVQVYLHVLQVSPSSTQTEMRAGSSFTLSCQLYIDGGYPCQTFFITEGIQLVWVNQSGVNLQSDSRYQISSSPQHCNISLTTTLLHEDRNTEWTCRVTRGDEVKTSVSYTVTYLDASTSSSTSVILAVTAAAALLALLAVWLICKKRAGSDKKVISSLTSVTPVTPVTPPAADVHGKTDDVAYAEVIISRNTFPERVESGDAVTYAVIRGAEGLKNC